MSQHIARSISHTFRLPSVCTLCHQRHRGPHAVCFECQQHFTLIGPACYHCALPLPNQSFLVCGHCCKSKPYLDQVIAPYHFKEPLRSLLHEFKYSEGLYLSSFLANIITQLLNKEVLMTECLIPVPLHTKRLRNRGFNQAAELTKQLSRSLKLPYHLTICSKKINTPPQASLAAAQRRKNLSHAFKSKPIPYQHVTLIDDLLTTGSTLNELAKVLKNQGVQRVDAWCCARVVLDTPHMTR